MPTRASAPPTTARVEIAVGSVLGFIGALMLVTRITAIPAFIAELVIGFVSVRDFWPMVGGSVLVVIGVYTVLRGRRGLRNHRRTVARIEAMREREQRRQLGGPGGVSAGVAGTPHRAVTRF